MSTEMMRVMWCERPQELELRRIPIHTIGDEDVLVKVAYAAICPWDVRAFSGLSSVAFPRILGHEVAGTVAAVGANSMTSERNPRSEKISKSLASSRSDWVTSLGTSHCR